MTSTIYVDWSYKTLTLFKSLPLNVDYQTSYNSVNWILGNLLSEEFYNDHAEFLIRCFPQQRVITSTDEGITKIRFVAMYGSEVFNFEFDVREKFSDNLVPLEIKLSMVWTLN